jgi:hypothetical protein
MKHTFVIGLIGLMLCAAPAQPQNTDGEIIAISDSIGAEIDQAERERYHLFPDIAGFQSARITQLPNAKYRLSYSYQDAAGIHQKSIPLAVDALELTRRHVGLTDQYLSLGKTQTAVENLEAAMLYRLGLRYAAKARYDLSSELIGDLLTDFPQAGRNMNAQALQADAQKLQQTRKALFQKGSLLNQSGRTRMLIFSGYYGLWLGIAAPVYFKADSPQAYAAGLLLGAPLSMLATHYATRTASISDGRATMISLGGHLGTWQGIGWTAMSDADGNQTVGMGALGGLAGIAAATLLTNKTDFSTGHAGLTSSGLQWGAWAGLLVAMIADHEEDDILRDMLIGSDALVIGTALATKNINMSNSRVGLINLAGVLGAAVGLGIDLLIEVDDKSTAFAIAGLGSMGGIAAGAHVTRNFDRGKELTLLDPGESLLRSALSGGERQRLIGPRLSLLQVPYDKRRVIPAIGVEFLF